MGATFVGIKKLAKAGIIQKAAAHNLREIQAELGADSHIDAARTSQNIRLAGPATAAEVANFAESIMEEHGAVVKRKDSVRAVEVLVSLPDKRSAEAMLEFFTDSLEWVRTFFPCPVVNAVIHLDEEKLHMHVVFVPLVNGRLQGSDLLGGRRRYIEMQNSFFEKVGRKHGLNRQVTADRLSRSVRDRAATLALSALTEQPGKLELPNVRTALHELIANSPETLLAALGLKLPKREKKKRSFVEIMTAPRPERQKPRYAKPKPGETTSDDKSNPIGFEATNHDPNPIGFETQEPPNPIGFERQKGQTLSCVGFGISRPLESLPVQPFEPENSPDACATDTGNSSVTKAPVTNDATSQPDDSAVDGSEWSRFSDENEGVWDEVRGEFVKLPPKRTGSGREWAKQTFNNLRSKKAA